MLLVTSVLDMLIDSFIYENITSIKPVNNLETNTFDSGDFI